MPEPVRSADDIQAWLIDKLAELLDLAPQDIDPQDTFDLLGLASRDVVSLSGDLEDWLGQRISPTVAYEYPTIAALARFLAQGTGKAQAPRPVEPPAQAQVETSTARPRPAAPSPRNEPIAVVGMACRFPGADNTAEFWKLLRDGVDAISEVPADRWQVAALYAAEGGPGKMNSRWGGFVRDIAGFDAHFFGIAPREAGPMDPQQRLTLEVAWEALEHAGIPAERVAGSQAGVFVGASNNDYSRLQTGDPLHVDAYTGIGSASSIIANRLSYFLDLRGPSLAVDTACSSSLVAVHLACRSLLSGECDLALAGGVNAILQPEATLSFSQAHMMAADGRCKAFDARADGYVRGEGCGMVVLKRLSSAQRDGDRILAVILGSAVNQDGHSNGLTAPNPEAQVAVIEQALAAAGVAPAQISYVEAHGTGTELGDPIEVQALGAALAEGRPANTPVVIGSVKTNIGHLESAAGIASLIKVILMLQHGELAPSLHFITPNPYIPFDQLPVRVQTTLAPWPPADGGPRLAGISSFGFGGTNAHLIVADPPVTSPALAPEDAAGQARLLPLSARSPEALHDLAVAWRDLLAAGGAPLRDLAYTAAVRRSHHSHRLAVSGDSAAELHDKLSAFLSGDSAFGLSAGQRKSGHAPAVAFLFSGQGSQWPRMGYDLLAQEPVFRETVERIDQLLHRHVRWSLLAALAADPELSQLGETAVAQPAIFAVQMGLVALLRAWGVEPAGVAGHSLGEIAAAAVAGALSLEDAVAVVYHRSRLMQQATGLGKMAAVAMTAAEAQAVVAGYAGRLSLAAINSPTSVTLSGEADATDAVVARAHAQGIFARVLPVNYAFHSAQMEPFLEELAASLATVRPQPANLNLVSTMTGRPAVAGDYGAAYWSASMRQPVRFADAVQALVANGCGLFVEIGPHPVLARSVAECVAGRPDVVVTGSLHRDKPGRTALLATVGELYCAGLNPRWEALVGGGQVVDLPGYPWQHRRYWTASKARRADQAGAGAAEAVAAAVHPLLGARLFSPALRDAVFQNTLSAASLPYLADHRVAGAALLPASAFLEMALAATRATGAGRAVENVALLEALPTAGDSPRSVQVVLAKDDADAARFQVVSSRPATDATEPAWVLHATGVVRRSTAAPAEQPAVDLATIQARLQPGATPADFYARLAAAGLAYGPTFRGIEHIWRRDSEALGRLQLPASLATEGYEVHPALLDAAFQLVAAALPLQATQEAGSETVYVPVAVDRLRLLTPPGPAAWAHVKLSDATRHNGAGSDTLVADVHLYSDTGLLAAEVTGLRVRRVDPNALRLAVLGPEAAQAAAEQPDDWLYTVAWQPVADVSPDHDSDRAAAGLWYILADAGGVGDALAAALAKAGGTPWVLRAAHETRPLGPGLWAVDPSEPGGLRRVIQEGMATGAAVRGAVHLWALDVAADGDDGSAVRALQAPLAGGLHLVQALMGASATPPRLWLATRGGQAVLPGEPVTPAAAALWGFGATVALEQPELRPVCIDLDPAAAAPAPSLLSELLSGDAEDRVALRNGRRYAARLVRQAVDPAKAQSDKPAVRLEIPLRGALDNLTLAPLSRARPGPGQVEIAVRAAGLNFRDVMNALGLYPGDPGLLGGECAGVVTAVGAGVERLKPGDAVMGIAPGSFASFTTTLADLVVPIPAGLSFDQAATIPIAFLTAHYALNHLAQMRAGDRVLIHAASGGVGLAAIQLAQRAGATLFATAGSPAKRQFLQNLGIRHVMNSRTLAFADEVLAATGGQGVDIVLNSLSGEFIDRGLAALAVDGRFIELGKVGIWSAEQVAHVRPAALYRTVALDDLSAQSPRLIQQMLQELAVEFEAGRLQPLPVTPYPLEDAASAFRLMAQTKHIGKVVLLTPVVAETSAASAVVRPDATYLVTGGLGALGLQVANWLVSQGARSLVLAGRHAASEQAQAVIASLEAQGATVTVAQMDASQADQVAGLLASLRQHGQPLRGIVHAAGVLDDGVLRQQSWERFVSVLAPKAEGAWNLHRLTQDDRLDFFVAFSSAAAVLGSPGQGNYAAANAFLDGLAQARRAAGLPALSVNWGPWAAAGMAAALDARDRSRLAATGLATLSPEQGLATLALLLAGDAPPQVVAARLQWPVLAERFPAGEEPPLLKELIARARSVSTTGDAGAATQGERPDWVARLQASAPSERVPLLVDLLRERALRVLGLGPTYPLDAQRPLQELGLDSLMAVELKNSLSAAIGRNLAVTLLFEHPTLTSLAKHVVSEVLGLSIEAEGPATPELLQVDATTAAIEQMTDEEAEALLLEKLAQLEL